MICGILAFKNELEKKKKKAISGGESQTFSIPTPLPESPQPAA